MPAIYARGNSGLHCFLLPYHVPFPMPLVYYVTSRLRLGVDDEPGARYQLWWW
jgi:hypothetical protein